MIHFIFASFKPYPIKKEEKTLDDLFIILIKNHSKELSLNGLFKGTLKAFIFMDAKESIFFNRLQK